MVCVSMRNQTVLIFPHFSNLPQQSAHNEQNIQNHFPFILRESFALVYKKRTHAVVSGESTKRADETNARLLQSTPNGVQNERF